MSEPTATKVPRLYIASDLHLAEGLDPRTRRYARLEGFFYDEEFASFLAKCTADAGSEPAVLILNGDVFDFLSCLHLPSPPERKELGFGVSGYERKYGLASSEQKAVWKLEQILRGHPGFFTALVRWMAAGHRLVLIRGNHDLELFWPAVRWRLVEHLVTLIDAAGGGLTPDELRARFEHRDWFYYEEGRIFVEHGHQYEESNCVPNLLYPVFPRNPAGGHDPVLDYPAGSWFLQIVFNRLRVIDPIRTKIITGDEYGRLVTRSRLLEYGVALGRHLPFMLRMAREFQRYEQEGTQVRERHRQAVHELAAQTGLGDRLWKVDGLKARGATDTNHMVAGKLLGPVIWKGVLAVAAVVLGMSAFFGVMNWLPSSGLPRALSVLLSSVVGVGTFLGAAFLTVYLSRQQRDEGVAHAHQFRDAAVRVARVLGVRVVVMGHTHLPDYYHAPVSNFTYVNSGTWTFVRRDENIIKPNAHSFTFVRVVGDEAELLRWSDLAERFEPVVLLTPDRPRMVERIMGKVRSTVRPPVVRGGAR